MAKGGAAARPSLLVGYLFLTDQMVTAIPARVAAIPAKVHAVLVTESTTDSQSTPCILTPNPEGGRPGCRARPVPSFQRATTPRL